MFAPLRQIFRARPTAPPSAVPAGTRYYAVGDIHGRIDLFDALIAAIEEDDRNGGPAQTTVILLGDLVDRGPDSAGVVARARAWSDQREVVLLAGNHEEMFLNSFDDARVLRHFLRHGGRQTVLSYGVPRSAYDEASLDELQVLMRQYVPSVDRDYLSAARNFLIAGDYVFVHAGILPDVAIEDQSPHHLRWIREQFLDHGDPHSHFVVHGHTITEGIDDQPNRIGIDTGAYGSGRLTALVLEGTGRRTIQAVELDGKIAIETGTLTV